MKVDIPDIAFIFSPSLTTSSRSRPAISAELVTNRSKAVILCPTETFAPTLRSDVTEASPPTSNVLVGVVRPIPNLPP